MAGRVRAAVGFGHPEELASRKAQRSTSAELQASSQCCFSGFCRCSTSGIPLLLVCDSSPRQSLLPTDPRKCHPSKTQYKSDIIYQSVFELIHKEDRATFQSQFLWPPDTTPISRAEQQDTHSLPRKKFCPLGGTSSDSLQHLSLEEPSYLERNFVCRFRCLLDNSGFLELNFHGRLKFLPGKNNSSEDGIPISPQLTLFAVATPRQPLTILELQNKDVFFQTKHKMDFTPIACDSRGKVVLGYTDSELCRQGSGYQFIHAADAMYCAENHARMMRTGESGLTVFRLLTKRAGWLWVQSNAHLVFRGGQPYCIVARQRALTPVPEWLLTLRP